MPPQNFRQTLLALILITISIATAPARAQTAAPPTLVILDAKIITLDATASIAQAIAIRDDRIIAVGSNDDITPLISPNKTKVLRLNGATVIPGLIETHCHAIGVANASLQQPYAELRSVADIQNWIRQRAKQIPPGQWIQVPRTEITRIKERRHPTPAELDAACSTHPVYFRAVTHVTLNTLGFKRIGVTSPTDTVKSGRLIRDAAGQPLLIADGDGGARNLMTPATPITEEMTLTALDNVLDHYNRVGITNIFERATNADGYRLYQKLRERGDLTVRMTATFRSQFKDGAAVRQFTQNLGIQPTDGDDWIRPGPLKITVDGGIHWGTTHLSEPYGQKRADFYSRQDPNHHGELRFAVDRMTDIFATAHQLGWQMSAHVTGDAGVDRVLDALAASDKITPARDRRFNLIHAYFPSSASAKRAHQLGVGVDTQSYVYYKDADAIAEIYGRDWAQQFIAVGEWLRAGVPTAINADHMVGLDPDHAMNGYNPFLQIYTAVTRKDESGFVYGAHQRVSRIDALRCMTTNAAWLSFDENRLGSLQPGKLADFVVLDRDYLTCPEEQIRLIKPTTTIVGGNIVYQN